MKGFLVLGANLLLIGYLFLFLVDHSWWPKEPLEQIRHLLFVGLLFYLSYEVVFVYLLKKETIENGLMYQLAATTQKTGTAAYHFIAPFQKQLLTWTLIAVGLAVVGCLLVGLPGALLLEIPVRLGVSPPLQGDHAWPAALLVSILWPLVLPIGLLAKQYLIRVGYSQYALCGWISLTLVGIISLLSCTYWLFGRATE